LSINTDVIFLVNNSNNGVTSEVIVNPTAVNGTTQITVIVPTDAITGVVQIAGDQLNAAIPLQIVPVVNNVDLTSVGAIAANFRLTGAGLIEGNGTVYVLGAVSVVDNGFNTGPDSFTSNTINDLSLPYSDDLFGAVTVTTAGGTSAPFTVGFTQLTSVATTGTPANVGLPSANPSQSVTVTGTGLTANTDFVLKRFDDNGTLVVTNFNPDTGSVSGGGTQALITIPTFFNGAFAVHMVGSSFAPTLQIVPVVMSVDVDTTNSAQITGQGFLEGHGTIYHVGTTDVIDLENAAGPNVFSGNTLVDLALPVGGPGTFTMTTAGGTSAPVPWNVVSPVLAATVLDVAYNAAANEMLVVSVGTALIYRLNPTTGAQIGTFPVPVSNSNNIGLDITPVAFTLRDTGSATDVPIPAGSLIVFNGGPNPDRIVAMNPTTGAILASLGIADNFNIVGGAVTSTGRVFVLDPTANTVREINPLTGAEIGVGFAAGMDIAAGDIAIHPTTGNIWIASNAQTTLREYTVAGVLIRSIDVTPQSVSTELTGLAFRPITGDVEVLASSARGVIYILPDPLVSIASVAGVAGSTVTVPINIDNAKHLSSAAMLVQYDTELLDVASDGVQLGTVTAGGTLTTVVDDAAGTISIALTVGQPLGPGGGSLVEIQYQIKASATGEAIIDLQEVVLNDGALILTEQPLPGADPTDGSISIAGDFELEQTSPSKSEQHRQNDFAFHVGVSYRGGTNNAVYGGIENLSLAGSEDRNIQKFQLPLTGFTVVTEVGGSDGSQGDDLRKLLQGSGLRKAAKLKQG
jgi:hypothetical protein